MNRLKSPSCNKFLKTVNEEIAIRSFYLEKLLKKALSAQTVLSEGKKLAGIQESEEVTMDKFAVRALEALPNMQFIWLMTLFEAFVKEYIAERENVQLDGVKDPIKDLERSWTLAKKDETYKHPASFYNLQYVQYIFKQLYNIEFSEIHPFTLESGYFRMYLVHHNSEIPDLYFQNKLEQTIKKLKQPDELGSPLTVNSEIMRYFIEDFKTIARVCDYT